MNKSFEDFKNRNESADGEKTAADFDIEDLEGAIPTHRPVIFVNFFNEDNKIFINKEQHVIGEEAWEILQNSDRELFQKGGMVVSPMFDENNQVRLVEYDSEKMVGLLSEEITFVRLKISKGSIIPEVIPIPNKAYASYILKNCDHSKLRPVHTCINHPFVAREQVEDNRKGHVEFRKYEENTGVSVGFKYNIVTEPGIHSSGVYLNPRNTAQIAPYKNLKDADYILQDVFMDFPYATQASLSNTIAQLISGCMRFAIGTDMPPIALTTSQTHGSGKTMETDCIHAILYGYTANWSSRISTLDEYRKTLLTHAIAGDPMVCFDNLNEKLNIEALASVATARRLSGRILHTMSNITVHNYMQICINGTALDVSTEIADRTIWKVMSTHEKSMEREFKYKAIIDTQVIPNRPAILSAIFTYIQNWITKGCPVSETKPKMHRAKVWAALIGGILEDTIWGDGFLSNTNEQRIQADTTYVRWSHTIRELAQHIGVKQGEKETLPFIITDAMPICSYYDYPLDEFTLKRKVHDPNFPEEDDGKEPFFGHNMLGEDIGTECKNYQSRSTRLGMLFRDKSKNDGTPFGDWKLIDAGQYRQRRRFKFVWIGSTEIPEEFYIVDQGEDFGLDGEVGL